MQGTCISIRPPHLLISDEVVVDAVEGTTTTLEIQDPATSYESIQWDHAYVDAETASWDASTGQ